MPLAHFIMIKNELMNNDTDVVTEKSPLIILDSKSYVCMANNGKDDKQTRHISRRVHFVRNGQEYNLQKLEWCEGGLKLEYIGTRNGRDDELNPRL